MGFVLVEVVFWIPQNRAVPVEKQLLGFRRAIRSLSALPGVRSRWGGAAGEQGEGRTRLQEFLRQTLQANRYSERLFC